MNCTDFQFSGNIKSMEKNLIFPGVKNTNRARKFQLKRTRRYANKTVATANSILTSVNWDTKSGASRLFRDARLDMFALLTLFAFSIFDFLSSTLDYIGLFSVAKPIAAFNRKNSFATVVKFLDVIGLYIWIQ